MNHPSKLTEQSKKRLYGITCKQPIIAHLEGEDSDMCFLLRVLGWMCAEPHMNVPDPSTISYSPEDLQKEMSEGI